MAFCFQAGSMGITCRHGRLNGPWRERSPSAASGKQATCHSLRHAFATVRHGRGETALPDIFAEESRPGWLSLQLPPLEAWHEPLARLPKAMRQRIESPEFYHNLHRVVGSRFQTAKRQH